MTNYVQRRSDAIKYDLTRIGDEFGWMEETRGIDLALLDAEDRIEQDSEYLESDVYQWGIESLKDQLAEAREKYPRWLGYLRSGKATKDDEKRFYSWVGQIKGVKKQLAYEENRPYELEQYITSLDSKYAMEEEPSVNIYTYLEMYIDQFSLGELAVIMDVLEELKTTKKISWYYYIECGLAVSWRLAQNTSIDTGWYDVCERLRKHKTTNHRNAKSPSYDDRFYGEMSFNMEDAIDKMTECKELAKANHCSVQEAWYDMCERAEAKGYDFDREESVHFTEDELDEFIDQLHMDAQFD